MAVTAIVERLLARQLSRNGLFALGQTIFVTLSLFLVYRLVISQAGLDQLGIWSLLLAGSVFMRVGDISGAGALSRFVAMQAYRGHDTWARDTVHTVLITSIALNAVLSLILWLVAPVVLEKYLDTAFMTEARNLVPYAIANMFLGALAIAVTSGIDGTQRADQRALVMIAAATLLIIASSLLVPTLGVLGFAISQLIYQGFILLAGWLVLRIRIPGLGWFPRHWRRQVFMETTGYALKLNAIGVVTLFFEPLVKFSFNSFGGPGSVALYELASRLVVRVRDLTTAAALPLVPAFAAHERANAPEFRAIMQKVTRLASIAAVFNVVILLALAPLISLFMLERISFEFVLIIAALAAGWNMQLPVLGFYLAGQGKGILFWNFLSHTILALFVVVGVYTITPVLGTNGLLISIVLGFVASMIPAIIGNAYSLKAMVVAKRTFPWIIASGVVVLLLSGSVILIGGWL